MTTCFALLVRGRLAEAARANAAGLVLAAVCAAAIPWCLWGAVSGRLPGVRQPALALAWLLAVLGVMGLANWIARLAGL